MRSLISVSNYEEIKIKARHTGNLILFLSESIAYIAIHIDEHSPDHPSNNSHHGGVDDISTESQLPTLARWHETETPATIASDDVPADTQENGSI